MVQEIWFYMYFCYHHHHHFSRYKIYKYIWLPWQTSCTTHNLIFVYHSDLEGSVMVEMEGGGCGRWNGKRLLHPLIIIISSYRHHIVLTLSHIFFFPPLHVPCSIFIAPLYRIRCGLWWNGNGRRWEMEGWVMAAFEQLARQHQDGMGWDGTDLPQKEIFFPACASNDMHLPVWWVAWIQPESRLRLVPGSAVLFPFHIYFGKASSFPGLVADCQRCCRIISSRVNNDRVIFLKCQQ